MTAPGPAGDAHPLLPIRTDEGEELDAHFSVEPADDGVSILYGARWGRRGSADVGNSDYGPGLRVLVTRLASLGAVLLDATVESARARGLPLAERRLELDIPYPLVLRLYEPEDVRLRIGRAQASVGRAPGARGGGNFTRRIALRVRFDDSAPQPSELAAMLATGAAKEVAEAEEAVAVVAGRRRGQGFSTSTAERAAVEDRGMTVVREALLEDGWTEVEDVSARRSYDFHCRRRDAELRVEVKATRGSDEQVLVTRAEVLHARTHTVHLAVVSGVRITVGEEGQATATGGVLTWQRPWRPNDADLTALAYRWTRPT